MIKYIINLLIKISKKIKKLNATLKIKKLEGDKPQNS
jgi:hypothetical protein